MTGKRRLQVAALGAAVGMLAAWWFLRPPAPPPPPRTPPPATASIPATTRALTLPQTAPQTAPQAAAAPAPPAITAVRLGDTFIDASRGTLRRQIFAHGVYDQYDDRTWLWTLKEGSGKAMRQPHPVGTPRGAAALAVALTQPATVPIDPAAIAWPDVRSLEIADPFRLLDDALPPGNGPYSHKIVTAGVTLAVNRLTQAEDGALFVVCGERWIDGKSAGRELPPLRIMAGTGYVVGRIGRIDAPGVRLEIALVKGAADLAGRHRLAIGLVAGNESVAADMTVTDPEVTFRQETADLWRILTAADGMADVWVSSWSAGSDGKLAEREQRPAEFTAEDFARALLTQVALRDAP